MFEKIFNVFRKYEVTNDEKFKQFHEFHKWLVENMPNKLKQAYNTSSFDNKVRPSTNKEYCVDITIQDYLWWETVYNAELIDIKDIKTIKKDTLMKLAKILDHSITLDGNDKEIQKIIFEQLEEDK